MKTIWKYPLLAIRSDIPMPLGARVLCVQTLNNVPCIWALVNPNESQQIIRTFIGHGTGHQIEDDKELYIGTVQIHDAIDVVNGIALVHIFEKQIE